MAIARSAKIRLKINSFTLNSYHQVIVKIVKEVLNLFHIEVDEDEPHPDYVRWDIRNRQLTASPLWVETVLTLDDGETLERQDEGKADERESAALHRIVKLNLYWLLRQRFAFPPAPWGILHGVRPTKIVHRWIREGLDEEAILSRLQSDYACSSEKAGIITPMAFRQIPFLRTSDERTVSIYVGIPFCLTRCLYCSFPSNILPGEERLREFMGVLAKDAAAAKAEVERYGFRVQNIYIGGGTPTSLPDDFFAEMMDLVYNAFYGSDVVEFTVEAGRPDSMTPQKLAVMKSRQVTRVSVNPQTMQAKTLRRIGRRHTPESIVEMFHALRQEGFRHINMDVILGLPGETAAEVEDTMRKIVALQPDDITLHALALKRGSNLKLKLDENEHVELPDDEETRRMSEVAMRYVREAGMRPYYLYRQGYMSGQLENVGCSREGAEGMYNIQIMEEHQTILGIGGAATTKVVDFRKERMKSSFNAKDLVTYLRDIDIYIEKRAMLLREAYGEQEERLSC